MHSLNSRNHLKGDPHYGCIRESLVAEFKELIQTWTKHIENQNFIVTLYSIMMHTRKSLLTLKVLIHLMLILKLRLVCIQLLKLHSDHILRFVVDPLEHLSESTFSKLLLNGIILGDLQVFEWKLFLHDRKITQIRFKIIN